MKTIILISILVLAAIGCTASSIWAFVSFVIYIAKDIPFNWWSVGAWVTCALLLIASKILVVVQEHKELEALEKMRPKRSTFQERLQEEIEKRNDRPKPLTREQALKDLTNKKP